MQPLKLKWRRTWVDVPRDFCADAPEAFGGVGRVHEKHGGNGSRIWIWSCYAYLRDSNVTMNGVGREETKDAACRALEAYWFDALARLFPSGTDGNSPA